jgi:predicted dehydrogenase
MADYLRLLDETRPDVVSVGLPNYLHLEATLEALQRGMHVLCEKPLARTSDEAQRMIEAARRSGRVLMTGYHHRYQEAIARTRTAIADGTIGTVCSFRCRFAWRQRRSGTWNFRPEESGGGVLIDSGGHAIDLYRYLVGEVALVSAVTTAVTEGHQVEDNAVVLLEGAQGGTPGVIEVSWTTPDTVMELVVEGTEGTLRVDFSGLPKAQASLYQNRQWRQLHDEWPNPYARELAHFRDCIAGRATPLVDGHEGLRTLLVVEAAYRAAAEHRVVPVQASAG